MPTTKTAVDHDAEIEEIRQRRAAAIAQERERREKAEFAAILDYWIEREKANPDDPEVLRARASLLDQIHGEATQTGIVVQPVAARLGYDNGAAEVTA